MLAEALNRYQNRAFDAVQVVAEIVQIAKQIQAQRERGEATGLTNDELAFYDALCSYEAAKQVMKYDFMRQIAHELTELDRSDAKTVLES